MRLSEAAQARRKFRSTSGATCDKQMNGFKQVFFLFKTVSFISHILTALTPSPTHYLTIAAPMSTIRTVR